MAKETGIPRFISKLQKTLIDEAIPGELVFKDPGGNKYVNQMVVVDKLNQIFNYSWKWDIIDKGIEESKETKAGQTTSYYVWVQGQLSYPVTNPNTGDVIWVSKQAFGGKLLVGGGKVQTQGYKSASSDALKKAASMVGIASNVYMRDDVYSFLEDNSSDNWTQSKAEAFSQEVKRVSSIKESIGEEKFNDLVRAFCDGTDNYTQYGKVTPSNIEAFLTYYDSINKEESQPAAKPKFSFGAK